MRTINIFELTRLIDNPKLNGEYIRFKLGLDVSDSFEYRQTEIEDVNNFIKKIGLKYSEASDFFYGFRIKHLDTEYDLLKTCPEYIINIELKHEHISNARILKQLRKNAKYLEFINKKVLSFCYISDENKLFFRDENDTLIDYNFEKLRELVANSDYYDYDINNVYSPKEMLISPINNVAKFLNGEYILTERQEEIINTILDKVEDKKTTYIGVTGDPGTGKTLLIYDFIKKLKDKKILVIHCGQICKGHLELSTNLKNIDLIPIKNVSSHLKESYDMIVLDEAQRVYRTQLEQLEAYCNECEIPCIFSFDKGQRLMKSEYRNESAERIIELVKDNLYKLSNKIRISKELSTFINGLLDRKKRPQNFPFKNIEIIYEPDKQKICNHVKRLNSRDFVFIGYTNSNYSSKLDYQDIGPKNTHNVIGQEFDNICMVIDSNFYYNDDNKLDSLQHPNKDYIFVQLLYQGLTRAREKIALIVTNQLMLEEILQITKVKY